MCIRDRYRHLAVVDLLLRHPRRVDPNARSRGRRTALLSVLEESKYAVQYRAAVKGNLGELGIAYLAVVQRLLEDDRVDPNAEDDHGRGALDVACQPFMSEYVPHEVPPSVPLLRLLLANKRTQPSQHQWRAAPFYDAALAWVQRQRKRQRVCGGGNDFGSEATPVEFIVAAATGDVPTVESGLRNAAHVNPNMNAGFHGGMLWYRTLPPTSSALAVAVANDRGAVVRTLLQDARVDVNQQDRHGRTPLTLAAAACNVPLVQALLAHPDVNVNHVAWRSGMASVSLAAHTAAGCFAWGYTSPHLRGLPLMRFAASHRQAQAVLRLLLKDGRVARRRPTFSFGGRSEVAAAAAAYETALRAVKCERRARFRGIVRAAVHLRRLRLEAAHRAYKPGGIGYHAAAAHYEGLHAQCVAGP